MTSLPPRLYLDSMSSRGHFPATEKGGRKKKSKRIITPRPTPLLLQSKLPSKLLPDLSHTGIISEYEPYELQPCMPNNRLNPNFKTLANRRAHDVQFHAVRVEKRKELFPQANFTKKNHHDFMNKIMIDILEENKREHELRAEEFQRRKAGLGFGNLGNATSGTATPNVDITEAVGQIDLTRKAMEEEAVVPEPGKYTPKIRPKAYHSSLGLFECLWDTTEPPASPNKKYGFAQNKANTTLGERFVKKNGQQVVLRQKWDLAATFDAHFGHWEQPDNPLTANQEAPPIIEGLNGTVTRDEINLLSKTRKELVIGDTSMLSTSRPSDFQSFGVTH